MKRIFSDKSLIAFTHITDLSNEFVGNYLSFYESNYMLFNKYVEMRNEYAAEFNKNCVPIIGDEIMQQFFIHRDEMFNVINRFHDEYFYFLAEVNIDIYKKYAAVPPGYCRY